MKMLNKFGLLIIGILFMSCLATSSALVITVHNQDTGNKYIADWGEVKIVGVDNAQFTVMKGATGHMGWDNIDH